MPFIAQAAVFGLAALAATAAVAQSSGQPAERTLRHAGASRSYLVHAPPAKSRPASKLPVLLVLHGGGGRAQQIMSATAMNPIAAREGFVVIYPQGLDRNWNDGREFQGRDSSKDDVGFLSAVLDDVERGDVGIDRATVGVAGISNGGFMALRMACEAAGQIAGVAAVTATMPAAIGGRCRPVRPVPVLVINGTSDPLVPYQGGQVRGFFGRDRGAIWSTDRTVAFWAQVNGCSGTPSRTPMADRDPGDGTITIRLDHRVCGAPVTLLEVQGGGHAWPGGSQYLPVALIGRAARDFSASEEIAAFFMALWGKR